MKENEMQWEEQRLVRREDEEEEERSLTRRNGGWGFPVTVPARWPLCTHEDSSKAGSRLGWLRPPQRHPARGQPSSPSRVPGFRSDLRAHTFDAGTFPPLGNT